jgi:hypothetical protein
VFVCSSSTIDRVRAALQNALGSRRVGDRKPRRKSGNRFQIGRLFGLRAARNRIYSAPIPAPLGQGHN